MRTLYLVGATLLLGGCGGTFFTTLNTTPSVPPVDAFDCAKRQITALGYTQTSIDVDAHRITAKKTDDTVRRPDVQFRRMVERLIVEISPGVSGGTSMTVEAHTFAEMTLQRGPTEVEEKADEAVQQAAQAIVTQCGQ